MALLAPLAIAANRPGFSRAKRCCLRRNVASTDESIKRTPGDKGDKLFGSPAFAMPLQKNKNCEQLTKTTVYDLKFHT